tara:strand:- start:10840 stop:11037 length:198 start_codon:yes stop_codon:yes gene_type:complete
MTDCHGVECPECGHFYKRHSNVYGKRCKCGHFIQPDAKPEIIKKHDEELKKYQAELRNIMRRKLG